MKSKELILTLLFIILIVLTRTTFHIGNNIEFLTAFMISSSLLFKSKELSIIIGFVGLAITDWIIGNSSIFLFAWTGFLAIPLVGMILDKLNIENFFLKLTSTQFGGLISTLVFFFWTNFGVVLTTSMYSKNPGGLMQSYVNGLPFLYNQLLGNLIIVPVVFALTYFILNFKFHFNIANLSNRTKLSTWLQR